MPRLVQARTIFAKHRSAIRTSDAIRLGIHPRTVVLANLEVTDKLGVAFLPSIPMFASVGGAGGGPGCRRSRICWRRIVDQHSGAGCRYLGEDRAQIAHSADAAARHAEAG